jgi:Pyruvate/2-oxoacid:ferredoxin oxidoreductase gamma subunit
LGAALESGELGITKDEIKEVITERVKPAFVELNMKAIDYVH